MEADLDEWVLRSYLKAEVARRLRGKTVADYACPREWVTCATCGAWFELSTRNARRWRAEGRAPRCAGCRESARRYGFAGD
jgi:hypothetical protein